MRVRLISRGFYTIPPLDSAGVSGLATIFYYSNILTISYASLYRDNLNFQQDNFASWRGSGCAECTGAGRSGTERELARETTARRHGSDVPIHGPRFPSRRWDSTLTSCPRVLPRHIQPLGRQGNSRRLGTPLVGEAGVQGEGWSDHRCSLMMTTRWRVFPPANLTQDRRIPYTNYRCLWPLTQRPYPVMGHPNPTLVRRVESTTSAKYSRDALDMRELMIIKNPMHLLDVRCVWEQ